MTRIPLARIGAQGLQKLVKSMKTQVKIVKEKQRIVPAGSSSEMESLTFNFPYTLIPQYKWGKKAKVCFQMKQRTIRSVTRLYT